MERKEDTKKRIIRRNYEEKHKEERKAKTKVWATSIPRKYAEEIDSFLNAKKISKVALIVAGYEALKSQYK